MVRLDVPDWPGPVFLRAHTSDLSTFEQIFLAGELDHHLHFSPTRIVDAGANVGFASIAFALRYPEAQVVAIEFERANFDLLVRNTQHWPTIRPMHAALRGQSERVGVRDHAVVACAFEAVAVGDGGVEGVTVGGVMEHTGWDSLDLLKLDIEGSELEVLENAAEWESRVRAIAVETHDRFRPGCQAALERVVGSGGWQRSISGEYQWAVRE
ncbi:MAG: FkbM family methyltransferase [Acidobacteria bacterium]|nr:FkbM family methyltransferase [Acidobacteriota bacterium]